MIRKRMRQPRSKRGKSARAKDANGKETKKHPAITLMEEWLKDESGYDEREWPALKKALDEERKSVGARRLFDG